MNFLSDNERQSLKALHKLEKDKKVCDRIKAVLLFDKGWSYEEIAEALLLTPETIRNHVSDYALSKKLRPEGGGSSEKLSKNQSDELKKILMTHTFM